MGLAAGPAAEVTWAVIAVFVVAVLTLWWALHL